MFVIHTCSKAQLLLNTINYKHRKKKEIIKKKEEGVKKKRI